MPSSFRTQTTNYNSLEMLQTRHAKELTRDFDSFLPSLLELQISHLEEIVNEKSSTIKELEEKLNRQKDYENIKRELR